MQKQDLKIVFMGTPNFAKESLEALVESGYKISLVVCQPDRQSGRGMKLVAPPTKEYALENGIEVYQPEKLRGNEEAYDKIAAISPDAIIVVAYGKILPQNILDIPKYGCINVHGSLLPKYRGAAPIQRCIMNGETETGITTMYMDAGMDTGDVIYTRKLSIDAKDTYSTLYDKMATLGAETLVYTIDKLVEGSGVLPREKQQGDFTIAPMINDADTKIDFNKHGNEIVNKVRAMNKVPGAYAKIDEERQYKIYEVEYFTPDIIDEYLCQEMSGEFNSQKPGEIVCLDAKKNVFMVKCTDGYINIMELKPKNKSLMKSSEYIRGSKVATGDMFVI